MKPSSPAPASPWVKRLDRRRSLRFSRLFPAAWFRRLVQARERGIFGPSLSLTLGWIAQDAIRGGSTATCPSVPFWPREMKMTSSELAIVFPESSQLWVALSWESETGPDKLPEEKSRLSLRSWRRAGSSCRSCLHWKQSRGGSFRGRTKKRQGHGHGMFEKPKRESSTFSTSPTVILSQSSEPPRFRSLFNNSLTTLTPFMTTFHHVK
ncbi:hypothetical protein QBC39DRAFT_104275 [Podospora conica]|nr:hypothetical protein QBC39DRAFT_104275 [Schizothecium conicum]